jgi:predicted GNAT family N-acyltransferase
MIFLELTFATPEYDAAVALRYRVLREPLGLHFDPEELAKEYDQIHLAAYSDQHELLGYLNLTPSEEKTVKMRQVAVEPHLQGKGVGKALVNYSEHIARLKGFEKMVLHARETAVPFYQKLSYVTVGDRFEEVTIPHFKMEKSL